MAVVSASRMQCSPSCREALHSKGPVLVRLLVTSILSASVSFSVKWEPCLHESVVAWPISAGNLLSLISPVSRTTSSY